MPINTQRDWLFEQVYCDMGRSSSRDTRLVRGKSGCDFLATRLPVLRMALMHQRGFRREQLASLAADERARRTSARPAAQFANRNSEPSVREVQALIEAGARHALDEIECAISRMATGDYGRCRACGAEIPVAVLDAIPQTTLCLSCQSTGENANDPGCDRSSAPTGAT